MRPTDIFPGCNCLRRDCMCGLDECIECGADTCEVCGRCWDCGDCHCEEDDE